MASTIRIYFSISFTVLIFSLSAFAQEPIKSFEIMDTVVTQLRWGGNQADLSSIELPTEENWGKLTSQDFTPILDQISTYISEEEYVFILIFEKKLGNSPKSGVRPIVAKISNVALRGTAHLYLKVDIYDYSKHMSNEAGELKLQMIS